MDRKWQSGAAVSPPALDNDSDGYATNGNPGTGTPPTFPGAHWFHMITEEQLAVILAAGLTPDKTNVAQMIAAMNLLYDSQGIVPGGRLTLTTGVPVTTSDVSAATTVYYTPYEHDRIKLYDGTRWKWYTFTEMSQALSDTTKSPAAAAADKNYDMFVWDDGGTLRCTRGPTWDAGAGAGSDTARGTGAGSTELEELNGRWVNKNAITNGPAAGRGLYVGTIRTDGSSQVNDTLTKRHAWNRFNRLPRPMRVLEAADSWTYTTAAFRQANANSANQFDVVRGFNEDPVDVTVQTVIQNDSITDARVAIGLDSSNAMVAGCISPKTTTVGAAFVGVATSAFYTGYPGIGRHTLVWLEASAIIGTTTWYGDGGDSTNIQSGMRGLVWA